MKLYTNPGSFLVASLVVVALLFTTNLNAGDYPSSKKAAEGESLYLIEVPHTVESCLYALDETKALGVDKLNEYNWGCMVGDHTGYVIVSAKSEADALSAWVPASERSETKVIKLNKFTAEQIAAFHQKQ